MHKYTIENVKKYKGFKNEGKITNLDEVGKISCFFSLSFKNFKKLKHRILCPVSSRGYSSLSVVFSTYQTYMYEWVKRLYLLQILLLESAGYLNSVMPCSPLSQGFCIFCNLEGYTLLLLWYGVFYREPAIFQPSPMSARSFFPC